jgi:hypothetical protein
MTPPAFEEATPSVSGETPVQFMRPVKLIVEVCIGPVMKMRLLAGPRGSTSNGIVVCASFVATHLPPNRR